MFEWRWEDLNLLKKAKAGELIKANVIDPSDEAIMKEITKQELPSCSPQNACNSSNHHADC